MHDPLQDATRRFAVSKQPRHQGRIDSRLRIHRISPDTYGLHPRSYMTSLNWSRQGAMRERRFFLPTGQRCSRIKNLARRRSPGACNQIASSCGRLDEAPPDKYVWHEHHPAGETKSNLSARVVAHFAGTCGTNRPEGQSANPHEETNFAASKY